jgi:RND family efflux transporter MFP subunit
MPTSRAGLRCLLLYALAALPAVALAQAPAPPVTVGRAERSAIVQEVPVTGTVASPNVSRISAEVAGRVAEMAVDVGDRVEAGDRLARLDPELARLALERARAATREAAAALADAQRRLRDADRLSSQNALARTTLESLRAEVDGAEAALARFRAEERRQAALLARHEIGAPFAGAISRKLAATGEWVEPGTPLVELVSTHELRIDFQVPQEHYTGVAAGDRVDVVLDSGSARSFAGHVASVVPQSDPGARTFLVVVRLDDPDAPIIPGMSARARLRLGTGREGVVVPRDALLRHPDGRTTVWVLSGSAEGARATVSERRVDLGRAFDGRVEVVEGLEAGESVVLRGNEGLQEGQAVRVRDDGLGG